MLILKGNILVCFLVLISTYAIFTNLSAALGTETLASNGKGEKSTLLPVLGVAIAATYLHSNALLWFALVGYMALLMGLLAVVVIGQLGDLKTVLKEPQDLRWGKTRELAGTLQSLPNQKVIR